jgi:hypothetical protein
MPELQHLLAIGTSFHHHEEASSEELYHCGANDMAFGECRALFL